MNYPVVTPTATAAGANILSRRPNPAFGAVLLLDSDQTSNYNGLQVTVRPAPVAPRQRQRLLHAQQDHDQRAAA